MGQGVHSFREVTRGGFTEDMTFESLKEDAEEIYEAIWGKNKAKL